MRKVYALIGLITTSLTSDLSHGKASPTEKLNSDNNNTITITPLNKSLSNHIVGHRSHSSHGSHGSHRSHRSSSGMVYQTVQSSDPLGQPARLQSSYPATNDTKKRITPAEIEKRKNIIMRVQLYLHFQDYYNGEIDGIMGENTRKAIQEYKNKKYFTSEKLLDENTLNSFGIKGF